MKGPDVNLSFVDFEDKRQSEKWRSVSATKEARTFYVKTISGQELETITECKEWIVFVAFHREGEQLTIDDKQQMELALGKFDADRDLSSNGIRVFPSEEGNGDGQMSRANLVLGDRSGYMRFVYTRSANGWGQIVFLNAMYSSDKSVRLEPDGRVRFEKMIWPVQKTFTRSLQTLTWDNNIDHAD
jgi:hypothetical protein